MCHVNTSLVCMNISGRKYRGNMAKNKRLLFIFMCLSTIGLISGKNENLGVLSGPAGYSQHPLPVSSGQKDNVQAELSPVQNSSAVQGLEVSSVKSTVSGSDARQIQNTGKELQQNWTGLTGAVKSQSHTAVPESIGESRAKTERLSDEPSQPHRPDFVEISFSNTAVKSEEKSQNVKESIPEDSQNTFDQYSISSDEEDGRSYGNPPLLEDSEELVKNISGLSSKEIEMLQAEITDELGFSAIDPALAMLPMGQNFQAAASEGISTPHSIFSTSTTESNKYGFQPSYYTDSVDNIIQANPEQVSKVDNADSMDIVSRDHANELDDEKKRQSHGRKVLNGGLDDVVSETDEYENYFAEYFTDYYDKDEDDYEGGEVLASVGQQPEGPVGETENEPGKKLDITDFADSGEPRYNQHARIGTTTTTEVNLDEAFSLEKDDDGDWYYDPEDAMDMKVNQRQTTIPVIGKQQDVKSNPTGDLNQDNMHPKKALQAPKGTIILYTFLIVLLIACFVIFTVWKSPFQNGRPLHHPAAVRTGDEEKRLLDHPFV